MPSACIHEVMNGPGGQFRVLDEQNLFGHGGVCHDHHPNAAKVQSKDVPVSFRHLCVRLGSPDRRNISHDRPRKRTWGEFPPLPVNRHAVQKLLSL